MSEYVDVFDKKWTKRYKIIKWTKFCIKISLTLLMAWALAEFTVVVSPYISDPEMELETVLTNSQITAMAVLLLVLWAMDKFFRMLNRI